MKLILPVLAVLVATTAGRAQSGKPPALQDEFYRHQQVTLATSRALAGKIDALSTELLRHQTASLETSKRMLAQLDDLRAECAAHQSATATALAELRTAAARPNDPRVAELVRKQGTLDQQQNAIVARVAALELQLKPYRDAPAAVPANQWSADLDAQRRVIAELEDLLKRKK